MVSAWTKEPVKDVYAFLNRTSDSSLVSDAKGNFTLNYLPEGEFYLSIVDDVFPDQKWSTGERTAFKENAIIQLQQSVQDSVPFLLSQPMVEAGIRSVNYTGFGQLYLGIHPKRIEEDLYVDGQKIDEGRIVQLQPDSLILYLPKELRSKGTHTLAQDSDSLRFRISSEEEQWNLKSGHKNELVKPSESLTLQFDGNISTVDEGHIHLFNAADSSELKVDSVNFHGNQLKVDFNKNAIKELFVYVDSATVRGELGQNANFEKKFSLLQEREVGVINLNLDYFSTALIIDVVQEKKEIMRLYAKQGDSALKIKDLLPGSYTFRVVVDENANRIWDSIDPKSKKQAELVYYFEGENKLRANWELDIHLRPEGNE